MADKQQAPQAHEEQTQPGSLWEAQEALLKMPEPEGETPETEEAEPTEEEESQPIEEDESFEEESEEEEEADEAEEESEESDEFDEDEEEPLFPVIANGEEVEVTYDELIKGYSRQSDYTRKTQELAGEREQMSQMQHQWQQQMVAVQSERQQYADALGQLVQQSMTGLEDYSNVDWETLKEDDPIAYITKRDELRDAQDRIRGMQEQQAYAQQQQDSEMQRAVHERSNQEKHMLLEKIPEWKDKDTRDESFATIRAYATEQGFSDDEISSLIDHRSMIVLMKAQKYDELQNSDIKSKKIKNKPKVVRSGSPAGKSATSKSKRAAKMKRLRGSGHVDDAASILEDMFKS